MSTCRFKIVGRHSKLAQIIHATGTSSRLADLLNGGQQHADQNPNDRYDNQQLD
jgi:hypothetical protein